MLQPLIGRTFTVPQTTTTGPNSDGYSASIGISDLGVCKVTVTSTGTVSGGIFEIYASDNGTNWLLIDTVTKGGNVCAKVVPLLYQYASVRVRCTENVAGASGVVAATVAGVTSRS